MSIPMPPPMPGAMPPPPPPFVGGAAAPPLPSAPPVAPSAAAAAPVPGAVPMPPWEASAPQAPAQEYIPASAPQAPPAPPSAPPAPPAPAQYAPPAYEPSAQALAPVEPQANGMVALGAVDFDNMTLEQIALAQGIVGLDFDQYGVLPICSLNKGAFKLSDGTSLGTEFVCVIQEVKPKYLFKTAVDDKDPRNAVAYSYDKQTSNGRPLQAILDGWAQQGMGYEIRNYLEATCVLEDNRIILLSIPQQSISRLTSHVITVTVSKRLLSQVKTRVFIGPEVTKVRMPFNPISFEVYAG